MYNLPPWVSGYARTLRSEVKWVVSDRGRAEGCTKAQYKIHKDYFELSGKATLVETKHEITELETSMALRQSV